MIFRILPIPRLGSTHPCDEKHTYRSRTHGSNIRVYKNSTFIFPGKIYEKALLPRREYFLGAGHGFEQGRQLIHFFSFDKVEETISSTSEQL